MLKIKYKLIPEKLVNMKTAKEDKMNIKFRFKNFMILHNRKFVLLWLILQIL